MASVPGMTDIPSVFDEGEFEGSIQNEKRALLAAIAEHGTSGAIAFEQARQEAKQQRSSSNERAAARGGAVHDVAALRARAFPDEATPGNVFLDDITQASVSHGRELDRLAASNAAYLDQISAAGAITAADLARQRAAAGSGGGGGGGGGGLLGLGEEGDLSLAQLMKIVDEEGLSDQEAVQLARDIGAPAEWEQSLFNYRNPAQDPEGLAPGRRGVRSRRTAPIRGGRAGAPKIPTFSPQPARRTNAAKARKAAKARRSTAATARPSAFDEQQSLLGQNRRSRAR